MKLFELVDKDLELEAKNIINKLIEEYNNNKKYVVNCSFEELIHNNINDKYRLFKKTITKKCIKNIPDNLIIDPSNTYIFIDKKNFKKICNKINLKKYITLKKIQKQIKLNLDLDNIYSILNNTNITEQDALEILSNT